MCSVLKCWISVPVREMALSGGDVIDVIHAIEYRTDNAVSMFGGRPANHIKVINVRGGQYVSNH